MSYFGSKGVRMARVMVGSRARHDLTQEELRIARRMIQNNSSISEVRAALGLEMPTPSLGRKLRTAGIHGRRSGRGVKMHYGVEMAK